MSPAFDHPAPRARNKLRKPCKHRPGSVVSNVSSRDSIDSPPESGESHRRQMPNGTQRASLHLPPDLSDPKWQEYVRNSGFLRPMEKSPRPERTRSRSPSKLIPELAHLAANDPSRSSLPRSSAEELSPCPRTSSSTPSSSVRRYAKTPVVRTGQREGSPETARPERTRDVELIADQYRALLEARSCEDLGDAQQDEREEAWHDAETRQLSIETIRSAITRRSPLPQTPGQSTPPEAELDAQGSPTSDGTLVDFEEDAIYFKPAFTPEALSPIPEDGAYTPMRSPSAGTSTAGLQICMDLLTRELLASSVRRSATQRGSTDVLPLQVWLMIEAYEKLQDQVREMQLPADELDSLEDMLDMWLQALYRVHEKIADGRRLRRPGEGEMEELPVAELD